MGQLRRRGLVHAAVVMIVGGLLLAVLTVGNVDRASAQTPDLKCDVGTLIDGQCVEEGEPPSESGPPECPALPELYPIDDYCYMLVEGGEKVCPDGSLLDPNGVDCRQPVDKVRTEVPGTPICPAGSAAIEGACLVEAPALRVAPECLPDALGSAGNCYRLEQANRSCAVGVLAGDVCVIEGPRPVTGPGSCPLGPNVFEDGTFCYTTVELVDGGCPAPLVVDPSGTVCRRRVEQRPGPLMCVLGFGLVDGRCVRYDGAAVLPLCDNGTQPDDFGFCRIAVPDRVDELFCLPGGELANGECLFTLVPADCEYNTAIVAGCTVNATQCPEGFVYDGAGPHQCGRTETASQYGPTCPDGARGVVNGCYILVAKGPAGDPECLPGTPIVGGLCFEESAPIIIDGGQLLCLAVGSDLVDGRCVRSYPPAVRAPQCPVGSVEFFDGGCRKPVANARGAYYCEGRFASLLGRTCFISADAQIPCSNVTDNLPPCVDGDCPAEYQDVGDTCVRTEPALLAAVECPVSGAGVAGSCYWYFRAVGTNAGSCDLGQVASFGLCEIEGQVTETEPRCPVSRTVFEDGDFCYTLVSRVPIAGGGLEPCAAPLIDDPNGLDCRRKIERFVVPSACEEHFALAGSRCVRYVVPASSGPWTCSTLIQDGSGRCRFSVTDAVGPYYCEDPGASRVGDTCTSLLQAFTQGCPDGYSPDDSLGGICARFEPATPGPATCPIGARGEPGDCYILLAREPGGPVDCDEGTLLGSFCVIAGDPPVDGVCADRFGVVDGECIRYESPVFPDPQCPVGTEEDADGNCRRQVADAEGPYVCEDPAATLNGRSCVFTSGFVFICNGDVALCGEPTVELVCQEILDGMDCYRLVSRELTCPDPGTPHVPSMTCRKPVEMVARIECPDPSFEIVDGQCWRYSAPTSMIENQQGDGEGGAGGGDAAELVTLATTDIAYVACAGGTGTYSVSSGDVTISGDLVESPVGVYTATYEVGEAGTYDIVVNVSCPDGTTDEAIDQVVFIDPSGVILDCAGDPVVGAEVTLLRSETETGELVAVADGDASVMDPSVNVDNPTTTGADGRYRWDVTAAFYQVEAEVAGQPLVRSAVLEVPPARTDVDLVFADLNCPAPEPTAEPTTVVTTTVRPTSPVLPSPVIESVPGNAVASAVTQPAPDAVLASPPLAVTGTEAGRSALLGVSLLAAGAGLLGAGCIRRRHLADRS